MIISQTLVHDFVPRVAVLHMYSTVTRGTKIGIVLHYVIMIHDGPG